MLFLYGLCFIPFIVGLVLWYFDKRIQCLEFLGSLPVGLITVAIINWITFVGLTGDVMINSGELVKATYYPQWIEEYQQSHTTCTGSGKSQSCSTYYTTEHRTHQPYWESYSNIDTSYNLDEPSFRAIANTFGNYNTEYAKDSKSGFDGGDPNIYTTYKRVVNKDETTVYYPVTKQISWTNKIKATKSVFKFVDIPKTATVYEYPVPNDSFKSNRLLGEAQKDFKIETLDALNGYLGDIKHVNLIIIGYKNSDSMQARYQESAWLGGKENDLVLTYGKDAKGKVTWAYVFGWTNSEEVKRNLETILMSTPLNKSVPEIRKEIAKNYTCKDFKDFNYLSVEPPLWSYILVIVLLALTQFGYYYYMLNNDFNQGDTL